MSETVILQTIDVKEDDKQVNKDISFNDVDILQFISDCDASGVPWAWYGVRDQVCKHGCKALNDVFDYYNEHNFFFDSWTNYLLACSHFDKEELNGKNNRQHRKHLEWKVKRLMKKAAAEPKKHPYEIIRQNRSDLA